MSYIFLLLFLLDVTFHMGICARDKAGFGWVLAKRHIEVCMANIVGRVHLNRGGKGKLCFKYLRYHHTRHAHLEMS